MNKMWNWTLATVGGFISVVAEQYGVLLLLLAVAMVFDVITGLLASAMDGTGLNSVKAREGVIKKSSLLIKFFFGIFLDYFLPNVLAMVDYNLPFNLPFGMIIATFIIITESISICENFYRIDSDSFPHWIAKFLSIAKEEIDPVEDVEENQGGKE